MKPARRHGKCLATINFISTPFAKGGAKGVAVARLILPQRSGTGGGTRGRRENGRKGGDAVGRGFKKARPENRRTDAPYMIGSIYLLLLQQALQQ